MRRKHLKILGYLLALCFAMTIVVGVYAAEIDPLEAGLRALAASLSIGLSCIAAGYAVARSAPAAIGAVSEKPEVFGKSIVFVGLAEGIAIYGLLIAILVMP